MLYIGLCSVPMELWEIAADDPQLSSGLQDCVRDIIRWINCILLKLNVAKSEVIYFS